jgi:hypothetical protein
VLWFAAAIAWGITVDQFLSSILSAGGPGAAGCASPSVHAVIDPGHRPTVGPTCLELTVTDSTSIMGGD